MAIYLSHQTAADFLASVTDHTPLEEAPTSDFLACAPPDVGWKALNRLDDLGLVRRPVHVVVPQQGMRRPNNAALVCHSQERPLPPGSFLQVEREIFVASPELCLLQLASEAARPCWLSEPYPGARLGAFPWLVMLGFEMCGLYATTAENNGRFVTRDAPLTSPGAIRGYIEQVRGARGSTLLAQVTKSILPGSRSPMETALAMQLVLPRLRGGWGLPRPVMNLRIDLAPTARAICQRRYVECDLGWPRARLDVEYDSDAFHLDPHQMVADAEKRAALTAMGFDVVSVVWNEVRVRESMDALVRAIAGRIGWRLRPDTEKIVERRCELRAIVLPRVRPVQ